MDALGATARTVVRGGVGDYVDALEGTNSVELSNERTALLPLGTTRLTASGSNLFLNGQQPLAFRLPTRFTGDDLIAILPALRVTLAQSLNLGNRDFAVRNIDQTKEASNLFDAGFVAPSAVHVTLGIQHELTDDTVVSADVVVKRFRHTTIPGIDRNLWNSARGPVLQPCLPAERSNVLAMCSNGPITFDESVGWARYRGLVARLDKRFSSGRQLLVSYAFGSYVGTNGTGPGAGFSNDDWTANVGPLPTDRRHELNVSAIVALPHRFQLALNLSAASAPPFSAGRSRFQRRWHGQRSVAGNQREPVRQRRRSP